MERSAAFPVKEAAEMAGNWRWDDLCPFSVPSTGKDTGKLGNEKGLSHVAGTCGDGLAGRCIPCFIVWNVPVRFPSCLLFRLSICRGSLGGKEVEKGIFSPKWSFGRSGENGTDKIFRKR